MPVRLVALDALFDALLRGIRTSGEPTDPGPQIFTPRQYAAYAAQPRTPAPAIPRNAMVAVLDREINTDFAQQLQALRARAASITWGPMHARDVHEEQGILHRLELLGFHRNRRGTQDMLSRT